MTQITLNPAVARECGEYAAVLYDFLQNKTLENGSYTDRHHMRNGISWVPKLTNAMIVEDLPVFPDTKTVKRAVVKLTEAGLLITDSTGRFLDKDREHKTGRKRDLATWWHVSRQHVPRKDVPAEFFDETKRIAFNSDEAREWGIPYALILAYWRAARSSTEVEGFKVLSPATMCDVLPGQEQAIARQIKEMVEKGLLLEPETQPKHRKFYILPSEVKNTGKRVTWAELQAGKVK